MLLIHGGIWKVIDGFLTEQVKAKGLLFWHQDSLFIIQKDILPGTGCADCAVEPCLRMRTLKHWRDSRGYFHFRLWCLLNRGFRNGQAEALPAQLEKNENLWCSRLKATSEQ